MTLLQEEAVEMIQDLSDDNIVFLIKVIQKLKTQKPGNNTENLLSNEREKKIEAFKNLNIARREIKKYIPEDFDPDKELEEARRERYGSGY